MRELFFVFLYLWVAQDKPTTQLQFSTKAEAAKLLMAEDDFVERLSPFDRAARLKTDKEVDRATYLKFVTEQTLDWTDAEKEKLSAAWERVMSSLAGTKFKMPPQIALIKTTGKEEGDAAYTRGTSIILPTSKAAGANLDALLAHELFHVLSRYDAETRERLYQLIGFRKCSELKLPADLQARRLTNPDAPVNDHCIQVKHQGQSVWVVPVLLSKADKYDTARGGEFFSYLQFHLMAIESPDTPAASLPQLKDGKPLLLDPRSAEGFMDQIGRNTGYIIHPDEILADNFSFLVMKRQNLPQPDLLEKIEKIVGQSRRD